MNIKSANFVMTIIGQTNGLDQVSRSDYETACAVCRGMGAKTIFVNGKEVSMAIGGSNDKMILTYVDKDFDPLSLFRK